MKRRTGWLSGLLVLAALALAVALAWPRDQFIASRSAADWAPSAANIARGAYLARAGDCVACHTVRGGSAYAGGRGLATPFGTVYGPNLTPDRATGLGAWSADDFWNALHNGRSRDGRYLYPAFPFPHTTRITRADSDALYAYLHSLAPASQPNRAHAMRFPFASPVTSQLALAGWRLLYFRPGVFAATPTRDASWNRGAYLVEGLGHCSACHSARNLFGASAPGFGGGMLAQLGWYAPALSGADGIGAKDDLVQLLHTGVSARAAVAGPMAEVVARSLQYLSQEDVSAMAAYLQTLPVIAQAAEPLAQPSQNTMAAGQRLYRQHCADCHGSDGAGMAPAYPALVGNRKMNMTARANAVRMVLQGGFAPATAGNPRPYGMPPFAHVLEDEEVAQVLSYVRASWGNTGGEVTAAQVNRYRGADAE